MEIIKKEENGVEFYTIELTGQSGMSQSGLAILAGVDRKTLRDLENTLGSKAPSEFLQPFVDKPLTLGTDNPTIDGKLVGNLKIYKSSYCAAVLKHYSQYGPDHAKPVASYSAIKFIDKGINDWIQDITGWKQRAQNLQPHTDVYIHRVQHMRDHQIADDLWMIFREAAELLLLIEKDWCVPINDYDILDGSIGKRWKSYRNGKDWVGQLHNYSHQYRDQRGLRECAAYELKELPHFRVWLRSVYIPEHLPEYLVVKYGKQAVRQIYTEIGDLTDRILQATEIKRVTASQEKLYRQFLSSRSRLLGSF